MILEIDGTLVEYGQMFVKRLTSTQYIYPKIPK